MRSARTYIFLTGLLLPAFEALSQFYSQPAEFSFNTLTAAGLMVPDSSMHPGMQPYIPFFDQTYRHQADTHRLFRFIRQDPALDIVFHRHVIQVGPRNERYKLTLDPVLNFQTGRDYGTNKQVLRPYVNTRGFIGTGTIGETFYFETTLAENQALLPAHVDRQARVTGVVPGQGRWKRFKITGFDYAYATGFFSIQAYKNLNIQAGHGKHKTGHGYRSLLLSDNAFNYPFARITHQWFRGRLQYTNVYAVLSNLVQASAVITPNTERLFQKKPAAFQQLSVNLGKHVNLGLFQGLIWQTGDTKNRHHLSWHYFNPVIFTNIAAFGLENAKNIVAGGDLLIRMGRNLAFYSQAMIDHMGQKGEGMGFQGGLRVSNPPGLSNWNFQIEYNHVGRTAYLGTGPGGHDYSHYNEYLANTTGQGDEFIGIADWRFRRFFFHFRYHYRVAGYSAADYRYINIYNINAGFLINPAYNLNIALGMLNRDENFSAPRLNNHSNYLYLALRTSIFNQYYDF